jgi:2-succinyl-5-enolpyruvyl-6-hydroxy-3-cyclohexene-1-carboxylate synthase
VVAEPAVSARCTGRIASVNPATERARALVAQLVVSGVRHVVLCPGSRSAPLAYAVHDLEASAPSALSVHVRHDERVAGFTALGIGRATGAPAAVVTTSGTAVANLHPAVLEAHHARVPLLVLSADRPVRLHGTWANQTTSLQPAMFGTAVGSSRVLSPEEDVAQWVEAARAAVARSAGWEGAPPGPVHLDLCFDDPLLPDPEDGPWEPRLDGAQDADPLGSPAEGPLEPSFDGSSVSGRTVVLAGDGALGAAAELATRFRLPLLAEPSSGARHGANAVGPYRLLLDSPGLGANIERVITFGRPTLSRPVTRLLARAQVEVVQVPTFAADPGSGRADVMRVSAHDVEQLVRTGVPDPLESWLPAWQQAGSVAAQAIDAVLDGWPLLTGPLVGREVATATSPSEALVLAASNPVRDVDLAGHPWSRPRRLVLANRGLSGIDGTVSTATGVALGSGRPTRVLVGDVALLHDLGALVLGPSEPRPDLTVVVVNDAGGGIFSLLEPGADGERDAASAARFERMFGTPHAVDLAALCSGLGVPYSRLASAAGLRERLASAPRELSVVEVQVDRADLRPLHEAIARSVRSAVGA